jgi:hypothetical protein
VTPEAKSCSYCCGFGVWPDGEDCYPATEEDAKTGYPTFPCPFCRSINYLVLEKYDMVEAPGPHKSDEKPTAKADDFLTSFKKFEERIRCVESSDSQEPAQTPMP